MENAKRTQHAIWKHRKADPGAFPTFVHLTFVLLVVLPSGHTGAAR